jgi:hypothetical protein
MLNASKHPGIGRLWGRDALVPAAATRASRLQRSRSFAALRMTDPELATTP